MSPKSRPSPCAAIFLERPHHDRRRPVRRHRHLRRAAEDRARLRCREATARAGVRALRAPHQPPAAASAIPRLLSELRGLAGVSEKERRADAAAVPGHAAERVGTLLPRARRRDRQPLGVSRMAIELDVMAAVLYLARHDPQWQTRPYWMLRRSVVPYVQARQFLLL